MRVSSFAHRRSGVASDGPAHRVSGGLSVPAVRQRAARGARQHCPGLGLRPRHGDEQVSPSRRDHAELSAAHAHPAAGK